MALSIYQQWSLRRIECSLRQSDPNLDILMANFAKIALTGEFPTHERMKPKALGRCQVIIGAILGIALIGAYAALRCGKAVRRYFDLNQLGLPEGAGPMDRPKAARKHPGSVDAS